MKGIVIVICAYDKLYARHCPDHWDWQPRQWAIIKSEAANLIKHGIVPEWDDLPRYSKTPTLYPRMKPDYLVFDPYENWVEEVTDAWGVEINYIVWIKGGMMYEARVDRVYYEPYNEENRIRDAVISVEPFWFNVRHLRKHFAGGGALKSIRINSKSYEMQMIRQQPLIIKKYIEDRNAPVGSRTKKKEEEL